jgi:cold shock CspA family protein
MTGRVRIFFGDSGRGVIEGENGLPYHFTIQDVAYHEVLGRGAAVGFPPTQGPRGLRATAVQRLQPAPTAAARSGR